MEDISVLKEGYKNIKLPRPGDLGYDLVASTDPFFDPERRYIEYGTNLFINPLSKDVHALIVPRSSISNTRLMLANSPAIIDNNYRGEIKLRFRYLPSETDFCLSENSYSIDIRIDEKYIYKKGDKIAQLFFFKEVESVLYPATALSDSNRGHGGFGSTGK
jgi:dUTP pyrophosphatase